MEEKVQFLTDIFFNKMRHDSSIVYPYYKEPEYAGNIARDYLNDNPDFTVPHTKSSIYEISDELLDKLETYCEEKCSYYGYDEEDDEEDDEEEDEDN